MERKSRVYLMCGLPCSGKSYLARQIESKEGAVRLILDEWLSTLYGEYSLDLEQRVERVRRCRTVMWSTAKRFIDKGIDVILDDGFFIRSVRERYAQMILDAGGEPVLYYLDTPSNVIYHRLALRNAERREHTFEFSEEDMREFERVFERPTADEGMDLRIIKSEEM